MSCGENVFISRGRQDAETITNVAEYVTFLFNGGGELAALAAIMY